MIKKTTNTPVIIPRQFRRSDYDFGTYLCVSKDIIQKVPDMFVGICIYTYSFIKKLLKTKLIYNGVHAVIRSIVTLDRYLFIHLFICPECNNNNMNKQQGMTVR